VNDKRKIGGPEMWRFRQTSHSSIYTIIIVIHIMASLDLTPAQAKALFDAGGFLIISDLPEGSEFSIDGT
jgi:hypothetical protein